MTAVNFRCLKDLIFRPTDRERADRALKRAGVALRKYHRLGDIAEIEVKRACLMVDRYVEACK